MSASWFNSLLWYVPEQLGWLFWLPFIGYGLYGLNKLYRLPAPATRTSRAVRVTLTVAFLCMVFTLGFNGLGPWAFHLLAIGVCMTLQQMYAAAKQAGHMAKSAKPTMVERVADNMTTTKP